MTAVVLKPFAAPRAPTCPQLKNAFGILLAACDAANSFAELFVLVRKVTHAKGMPSDEEQDLLRAMVVFAGAGLDSVVKQILRDALPVALARSAGAQAKFEEFVQKNLGHRPTDDGTVLDAKFLSRILTSESPRAALLETLIGAMTADSLQSVPQLARACAYLGVDISNLGVDTRQLAEVFKMRNQIVHEMDVQLGAGPHKRRVRARDDMVASTEQLLSAGESLLTTLDKRISTQTAEGENV